MQIGKQKLEGGHAETWFDALVGRLEAEAMQVSKAKGWSAGTALVGLGLGPKLLGIWALIWAYKKNWKMGQIVLGIYGS